MASFRVISIGVLASHPLWGERGEVRQGHATTTLIESGEQRILVDPSLPPQILLARLAERANLKADAITDIFLTSFHPLRRRGITAFPSARWLVPELEKERYGQLIAERMDEAAESGDPELRDALQLEGSQLNQCEVCPDKVAPKVDLFPLPGVTFGNAGLLISLPRSTALVCGDAIATIEHLEQGKVLQGAVDVETAQESFREAVEIADVLILGRDNAVLNPLRLPY